MEGDGPTAGSVLYQYTTIISLLVRCKNTTQYSTLKDMLSAMISRLRQYQSESLHCDAIVLATILNPKFRLQLFKEYYPDFVEHAQDLIKRTFSELVESENDRVAAGGESEVEPRQEPVEVDPFEETNIFQSSTQKSFTGAEELEMYLSGKIPCDCDILVWWRVS